MSQAEEWDWPPRPRPEPIEGRIKAERIVLSRATPRRSNQFCKRLQIGFTATIFGLVRYTVAFALAGVLLASLWLLSAIIHA